MTASRPRIVAARILAVMADAVQLGFIPVFVEGAASPLNDLLDAVVGVAMTGLVGWHWAFLPAFLSELVPFADLAPTWTVAVLIATRQRPTPPARSPGPPSGADEPEPAPRALPGVGRLPGRG